MEKKFKKNGLSSEVIDAKEIQLEIVRNADSLPVALSVYFDGDKPSSKTPNRPRVYIELRKNGRSVKAVEVYEQGLQTRLHKCRIFG